MAIVAYHFCNVLTCAVSGQSAGGAFRQGLDGHALNWNRLRDGSSFVSKVSDQSESDKTQIASRCPAFPRVMSLVLTSIYADARSSIPDNDAEKKNGEATAGVDSFLRYIEAALDQPDDQSRSSVAACAYGNFQSWAAARALTVEPKPYNRDGTVKRGEYIVGLNLIALKFRDRGFAIDPAILSWLRLLNGTNKLFSEKSSNRGNLRVWAGAASALHALLQQDRKTPASQALQTDLEFQDRVWNEAIAAIHDDGTIDAEVARGQRALIYHMFSFSAILVLRSAKEALGYVTSADETRRLRRLADMIGETLCKPRLLETAAKARQEPPGTWAFRIPAGFGADLLSGDWDRCGKQEPGLSDPVFGGNTKASAVILRRLVKP